MIYLVKSEDERLDTIVYAHYGNLDNLELVLRDNPHIKDVFLTVGDEVNLLEYSTPINQNKGNRLWD